MQIDALASFIVAIGGLSGLIVAFTALYQQRHTVRRDEHTLVREELARLYDRLRTVELDLDHANDEIALLRSELTTHNITVPLPRRRGDALLQQLLQREYGGRV